MLDKTDSIQRYTMHYPGTSDVTPANVGKGENAGGINKLKK
jgi:hypothetical protein